jgi:hypothetical protein
MRGGSSRCPARGAVVLFHTGFRSKRPASRRSLCDSFPSFFLKRRDHPLNTTMFAARPEHLQALFFRPPFQNSDVYMTDAPLFHGETVCLVKIDRVGPNQSRSIIVDDVLLVCTGDSEMCSEWKARPIGRSTHHVVAGKAVSESVMRSASASLGMGISSGPHALDALRTGEVRFLRRAANDQGRSKPCECKVKALGHLQYRGLNSNSTGLVQANNFESFRCAGLDDSR